METISNLDSGVAAEVDESCSITRRAYTPAESADFLSAQHGRRRLAIASRNKLWPLLPSPNDQIVHPTAGKAKAKPQPVGAT